MRLLDLKLNEANLSIGTLTSKPETDPRKPTKYLRINILIQKILDGEQHELSDGTEVIVKKSEAKRLIDLFNQPDKPSGSLILATERGPISISNFFKSEDIGGKSGGGKSEKLSNKGEASEGILGAALFAKLIARTRGKIDIIDSNDIWAVIDTLKQTQEDHYSVTLKDASTNVAKDSIMFTLKLKPGPYADLMDSNKRPLLAGNVQGAVEYANSADAQEYCEYFYLNGKPDIIHVITDGISGSTTKKSDIEVITTDPKTGKHVRQQLNISVKADSGQMGQVGGGGKGSDPFDAQKKLWNAFGIDIESSRTEFNKILKSKGMLEAMQSIYMDAATFLQDLLAGSFDDAEYLFLKDLVKGINYYATLNDPSVIMVSLEGGSYDVMSFANLQKQLKNIDLDAEYRLGKKSPNPHVFIVDRNSREVLFNIRGKKENVDGRPYFRNYIEKGPLLQKLTSIKK